MATILVNGTTNLNGGNFCPAVAAFSLEDKVGKDRDIVIKSNPFPTLGTGRRRPDQAHLPGKPEDDHVEKAAPGQANQYD